MTRQLVALLLALLLPLQLTWAAVGEYCEHETSPKAAQHFGHHAHAHKADDKKPQGKAAFDSDCSFCHAGAPAAMANQAPNLPALLAPVVFAPSVVTDPPSALARAPDRPQWLRLA
jgi:cytochrome c5